MVGGIFRENMEIWRGSEIVKVSVKVRWSCSTWLMGSWGADCVCHVSLRCGRFFFLEGSQNHDQVL